MNKVELVSSLKKAFLDLKGIDDYYIFCKAQQESNLINMSSCHVAYNSTVFSDIKLFNNPLSTQEFVIRDPKRLLNILNIFDNELDFSIANNGIKLKDKDFDSTFVLCDPSSINMSLPSIDEPESYDMKITFENGFIERFLKAKKANNSEIFTVSYLGDNVNFEIGDVNVFSNRIIFSSKNDVELKGIQMNNLSFSSNIIEEIIQRNSNINGYIEIFGGGLMKLFFSEGNIQSKYFLVALDII